MSGLLPCALCGAEPSGVRLAEGEWFVSVDHKPGCYWAELMHTEEQARSAWNARAASDEEAKRLRAALREVLDVAELYVPVSLDAPGFKRARAALAAARPSASPRQVDGDRSRDDERNDR